MSKSDGVRLDKERRAARRIVYGSVHEVVDHVIDLAGRCCKSLADLLSEVGFCLGVRVLQRELALQVLWWRVESIDVGAGGVERSVGLLQSARRHSKQASKPASQQA